MRKLLPKINIHKPKDPAAPLLIFQDHKLELKIFTDKPKELQKYLTNILPNDVEEYCELYSLNSCHLSEWWINLVKSDRDVLDLFTRVKPNYD